MGRFWSIYGAGGRPHMKGAQEGFRDTAVKRRSVGGAGKLRKPAG